MERETPKKVAAVTCEVDAVGCADCLEGLAGLPEHCATLVIAAPPYFRVKGEFDFAFADRDEFLARAERWAAAIERVLSPNGSLVWYCSDKMLGYLQVMLDRRFLFLNSCTIHKRNGIQSALSSVRSARSWLVNDERFLFYASRGGGVSEDNPAVLARNAHRQAEGMCHTRCVRPVIDYLNAERKKAGLTVADICKAFGMRVPGHWFTYGSQFSPPTRQQYERLRQLANGDTFRKEYDTLRKEYDTLRRPFDLHGRRQMDIFEVTVDSGESARLGHPTVKNWRLTRQLILTSTRPGDLVVVPFAGSGTECAAAAELGRHFAGFEIEPKWCALANKRAAEHLASPPLAI